MKRRCITYAFACLIEHVMKIRWVVDHSLSLQAVMGRRSCLRFQSQENVYGMELEELGDQGQGCRTNFVS